MAAPRDFIVDISVRHKDESVLPGWETVDHTVGGKEVNLNGHTPRGLFGGGAKTVYLCIKRGVGPFSVSYFLQQHSHLYVGTLPRYMARQSPAISQTRTTSHLTSLTSHITVRRLHQVRIVEREVFAPLYSRVQYVI